jgi:AraC-like DNA-binding protein
MLATAHLTERQIRNVDTRIAVWQQIKFLNAVADGLKDEFLGIRLAQQFELRDLGLLYYVQASSDTLGSALRRLARYSKIHNEGVEIEFHKRKNISITFRYVDVPRERDRHQIEIFATTLVFLCRQLAGRPLSPTTIRFIHRRFGNRPSHAALLGCNVAFGANVDEVCFPRAIERLSVVNSDPYLNRLLLKYCEEALSNRTKTSITWQSRVENALSALLPHGEITLAIVSRNLGIGQRTLARRLAAEGIAFSKVLDGLRQSLALHYLQEPNLPISEIAWLLGYGDISAFHHAFKRWTGKSPKRMRESRMQNSPKSEIPQES